jgi:hypothetical protein
MADGVFGPITRRLRARNKRKERLAADKKSEGLRKQGAANRKQMMTMLEKKGADAASTGVKGNLAAAGAASAGRAARADKAKKATKRFEQDTRDLGAANMRMNAAQKNKRVKSASGKSDRPSDASMRDSAAQRAALAKSEPKPTKKKEKFGVGDKYVIRGDKANVRKDQLEKTGLTQAQYMKQWRASGKRPTAATAKKAAPKEKTESKTPRRTGSARSMSRRKFAGGGMMKSKMSTKGGAMGGKKKMPPGMEKGGPVGGSKFPDLNKDGKVTQADILMGRGVGQKAKAKKAASKKPASKRTMMPGMTTAKMPKIKGAEGINKKGVYQKGGSVKPKGMKAGGMKMKSKMSTKGGSAGGGGYKKGGKVRGAGIARKGVRPAKMR